MESTRGQTYLDRVGAHCVSRSETIDSGVVRMHGQDQWFGLHSIDKVSVRRLVKPTEDMGVLVRVRLSYRSFLAT